MAVAAASQGSAQIRGRWFDSRSGAARRARLDAFARAALADARRFADGQEALQRRWPRFGVGYISPDGITA
jgi:hypothetical protein